MVLLLCFYWESLCSSDGFVPFNSSLPGVSSQYRSDIKSLGFSSCGVIGLKCMKVNFIFLFVMLCTTYVFPAMSGELGVFSI